MTKWITTPVAPELLRGALEAERTGRGLLPHRLPARARRQYPDPGLLAAEAKPSGVRLVFRTSARSIELDVHPTRTAYVGAPLEAGRYDLLVGGELVAQATAGGGTVHTVDLTTGAVTTEQGPPGTVRFAGLPAGEKEVELWLPHNETAELIALRTDAPVRAAAPSGRRVWLHHGSSISHGSAADSPTGTWPALAAAAAGADLVNLGLGGNALLDPFLARTIRDTPADLISLKLGINLVNLDVMRLRAFGPAVHGFLDTVREGHPTTPLLVVSPLLCPVHETTPGPLAPDFSGPRPVFRATGDPAEAAAGRLTLTVIRAELARITAERAAEDPYLHHLDGRELYGEADHADHPLPDQLHPDQGGHRRIAEHFAARVFGPGGAFHGPESGG
ncbi:GDSL-type esterase/lipase family protein [Kitasatospora sp. NPDC002227]|uniref:GDSL-type esterase/lipase family protein n=1 Tax=Kitasatospora sp. NPDC002227 TaxID=3154773 RepID=UPI00331FE773